MIFGFSFVALQGLIRLTVKATFPLSTVKSKFKPISFSLSHVIRGSSLLAFGILLFHKVSSARESQFKGSLTHPVTLHPQPLQVFNALLHSTNLDSNSLMPKRIVLMYFRESMQNDIFSSYIHGVVY